MIDACAALLAARADCAVSTAAYPIDDASDFGNPNIVKVVLDSDDRALYFSRAPIPFSRDGRPERPAGLRHVGLYAYRAGYLRRFPSLAASPLEAVESLEQLRVLWHGDRIAVHRSKSVPAPGVDTPDDLARVRAVFGAAPDATGGDLPV